MAPTFPNPNWPFLLAKGTFGVNPFTVVPSSVGALPTEMANRLYKQWSIRRGKQFELDLVQPAEFNGQWINTDGLLDPSNTMSALWPNVVPFRGYNMVAQYPPSVNLLSSALATGEEAGTFSNVSGVDISNTYGSAYFPTASATAFQGNNVWQATLTTAVAGGRLLNVRTQGVSPNDGQTYTASVYVRSATTGANPQVQPFIRWVDVFGHTTLETLGPVVTLTGNPAASWTRLTYTSTAPTTGQTINAYMGCYLVNTPPAGTWLFQADGLQWERAATASAFTFGGFSNALFSGMIERYPQTWDYNGTYGLVSPIAVDVMALLSQIILKECYVNDIVATSPTFFFELNEPANSTSFTEQGGRTPNASTLVAGAGGTMTPGTSITSATPSGKALGVNGPVVHFANTNVSGGNGPGTVIDLRSAGVAGPAANQAFTRAIGFRTTAIDCVFVAGTIGSFTGGAGQPYFVIGLNHTGQAYVTCTSAAGVTLTNTHSNVWNDGNWHLVAVALDATGKNLDIYVDGSTFGTATSATSVSPVGITGEYVGGAAYPLTGGVSTAFTGDLSCYAGWNGQSIASSISNLQQSFVSAYGPISGNLSFESSGNRYSRIAAWAGVSNLVVSSVGTATANMGPANDIAGLDALTALQNVVDTENGRHFVDGSGIVRFQGRGYMFQNPTPVWVFGENTAGGEIPYIDIGIDFDTTRISNNVTITQTSTNLLFNSFDATSELAYGTRTLTRNSQSSDPEEVRSMAIGLLARYKDPHLRIQTIKIDAGANPSLFPTVLAFELGQTAQINRRDEFGVRPTISLYGYIEQITHSADDSGMWQTELQISPLINPPGVLYATYTSLRTTLASNATAGASTIVINALPDAALNPIRANLASGNQTQCLLQIGLNTDPATEFNQVAIGGVPDLAAGWTTATLTLTTPLANNYTAGQGVFFDSSVNFDSQAIFDTDYFAY